jgi:hypothetical protein
MDVLSCSNVNSVDVLVVGGGPVGLAAALWFAKRGYNIVLLEHSCEVKTVNKRSFNERHHQVGLNAQTLGFIKDLDVVVWGEIKRKGCPDNDWVNVPIYILQNTFVKEILNYPNAIILFDTKIESLTCPDPKNNCRVTLVTSDIKVTSISPKIVVIADGQHGEKGTARQFFGFSSACKVQLSTYGIVGMTERNLPYDKGSVCLKSYSSNDYINQNYPNLGKMHIRLLGNMKERYIALGLVDNENTEDFKNLNASQIKSLLVEAYNEKRDRTMSEPEITEDDFSNYSKTPIPIVLDYRKETIKLLEGSSTIVSIEGDAARKTTFFSGSLLNSGYKALQIFFDFCRENKCTVFDSCEDIGFLNIDQKLLEKDQACLHISLELLIKGITYIGNEQKRSINRKMSILTLSSQDPLIYSISPEQGEAPWFIHIDGRNLISEGDRPPTVTFEWPSLLKQKFPSTNKLMIYSSKSIGVKVPKNAEGEVKITFVRNDGKITISPVKFIVTKIKESPTITNVRKEGDWLCIDGRNFKIPVYVTINGEKSKAYCNSSNSLIVTPERKLEGHVKFVVDTPNGSSQPFEIFL